MLGILGGMSIGIRIVLLRDGLLIPKYAANWFIVGILMIIGLGVTVFRQRFGLVGARLTSASLVLTEPVKVSSCAAVGSFLVALGIDLILNKQSGMSTGLRFLFDRNSSHFLVSTCFFMRARTLTIRYVTGDRPPRLPSSRLNADPARRISRYNVSASLPPVPSHTGD